MQVNLFIPGFSKCGTSSLFNLLKQFNEVDTGTSKEPKYFSAIEGYEVSSNYADWSVGGNYQRGDDWYKKVFEGVDVDAKYLLDASTIYSFDPESPSLIYKYNSKAKLIFIVRAPYDRIESHYFQELKTGMDLPPFDSFITSNHPRLQFYKEVSRYKKTITRYLDFFDKRQIRVVSLNELKNNSGKIINELSEFLNLNFKEGSLSNEHVNKRKQPKIRMLKNFFIRLERSEIAKKAPRWLQELGSKLMRKVDNVILEDINNKPKIDDEIKENINKCFIEDIIYLEENFNVKL